MVKKAVCLISGGLDSCVLRLKGFKEVNVKDPLEYKHYPEWYSS